jgi:hypothetical protein
MRSAPNGLLTTVAFRIKELDARDSVTNPGDMRLHVGLVSPNGEAVIVVYLGLYSPRSYHGTYANR